MNNDPKPKGKTPDPIKPQPEPQPQRNDVNYHMKVLMGIALVWLAVFIFVITEHAGGVRMMLPVIGLGFVIYLIYATISVLSKRKW
jgi:hypothetical protein